MFVYNKTMSIDAFIEQLELDVLKIIEQGIEKKEITPERAAELAGIVYDCFEKTPSNESLAYAQTIFNTQKELGSISQKISNYLANVK